MNVYKLVGQNVEVTDGMRDHVQTRLERLERFSQHIVDAKVVLHVKASSEANRKNRVEMQLNVPHGIIRAEEASHDMYFAIDAATEVLERQLKKFKDKFVTRTHRPDAPPPVPESNYEEVEEFLPQIVRNKRFELRPMDVEDAAAQMEALGHDFYVFSNPKTQNVNVVYKRRDGHYGLIEPH